MKTINEKISIPREWKINYDFIIPVIGDCMTEYGIARGMLAFIKKENNYVNEDIVAITCKNWVNPILRKLKLLSTGEILFYSPGGYLIEKNKDIKILGKMIFKMDNPYENSSMEEQLDFWN